VSDLGFTRSDLFSITTAEQAEFPAAVHGLLSADSYPRAGNNLLAPLTQHAACTLARATFTLHHYHRYDPLCWLGGAYLMPVPTEFGTDASGITAPWTTHDLLLDWDWRAICSQLMNAILGSVLDVSGNLDRRHGTGSTWLETGRRGQRTAAGR
jgi:hypothetical protein